MNQVLSMALLDNDLALIKDFVKIIAMSIRNEMEDFHVEHLSDEQMKELNPLIRTGIYNALFAIANYDKDEFCKKFFDFQVVLIPRYWEEPQLGSGFQKSLLKLNSPRQIIFHSEFLKEQYQIGNLYTATNAICVKIKPSFDFTNVVGDKHKHRNKISSLLRKEGYYFIPALDGYIKKADEVL